jgi:hypothetical protein
VKARIARRIKRDVSGALVTFGSTLPFPEADFGNPPLKPIPRKIWAFWDTGRASAPDIVEECLVSWETMNPDWSLTVLDADSAKTVLPRDGTQSVQLYSDLLRLTLICREGGVWVDATTLCRRPLNDFLSSPVSGGLCVVGEHENVRERSLSSWFIAAAPGHPLIDAWLKACLDYWQRHGQSRHYFLVHYIFEWMIRTQPKAKAAWDRSLVLPFGSTHLLQTYLKSAMQPSEDPAGVREALRDPSTPVHKLDWRIEEGGARLRSVLEDLC